MYVCGWLVGAVVGWLVPWLIGWCRGQSIPSLLWTTMHLLVTCYGILVTRRCLLSCCCLLFVCFGDCLPPGLPTCLPAFGRLCLPSVGRSVRWLRSLALFAWTTQFRSLRFGHFASAGTYSVGIATVCCCPVCVSLFVLVTWVVPGSFARLDTHSCSRLAPFVSFTSFVLLWCCGMVLCCGRSTTIDELFAGVATWWRWSPRPHHRHRLS